jgi:hypothetical protein
MTVKAIMPVRTLNLVAPLPHEGTAMHATDTAAPAQVWSGAVTPLIDDAVLLYLQQHAPNLKYGMRSVQKVASQRGNQRMVR